MEKKKLLFCSLTLGLMGILSLPGCQQQKPAGTPPQVCIASADTAIYLQEGMESPACQIKLDFSYLQSTSDADTVSARINASIQQQLFGDPYAALLPGQVLPALVDKYGSNYLSDVKELFEADMHNGMKPADVPAWYNYEFSLSTELATGRKGIWNYVATFYQYTGGAHPNTFITCLNLDPVSGKMLTADDVFNRQDSASICKLIMTELIKEANRRMETDTITTLDGLQEAGILLDTYLYIPQNFLLEKDGVTFYYNRYEIAPYSAGDFRLKVGYGDIQSYLK